MFMKDDKKKGIAALIIAKKKDPSNEDVSSADSELKSAPQNEDGMTTDYEMGIDSAVEDVMSALESKDNSAFKTSMRSLVTMLQDELEDSSRSDED